MIVEEIYLEHTIDKIDQSVGAGLVGQDWIPPTRRLINPSVTDRVFPRFSLSQPLKSLSATDWLDPGKLQSPQIEFHNLG